MYAADTFGLPISTRDWNNSLLREKKGLNLSLLMCVCTEIQITRLGPSVVPLYTPPLWTKVFTWLWNEKNVCVWANSVILHVVKDLCVSLALTHCNTPSCCELCLLTALCGVYSLFLGVCVRVFSLESPGNDVCCMGG